MIITQDKITGNSIIQASYSYFCKCLEDYKAAQTAFKYNVNYGTNSIADYVEDEDTFNFVVYSGIPELIPSHWVEINGEPEILYAGFIDLAVSFVNPIPAKYNNDFEIQSIEQEQYVDRTYNQVDYNVVSDETNEKIDVGMRLLEGFARFMRRKGIVMDGFKLTSKCEIPSPDGLFDNGFYRLLGTLNIQIKFAMQNKLGSALTDGEETRVWFSYSNEGPYYEIYNVFDFEPTHGGVDKTYPLYDKTTTITQLNQLNRSFSINFPELDFGGNKKLKELFEEGDLDKLNNIHVVYYDGKIYRDFLAVPTNMTNPYSMDKFNGITCVFAIKSDINYNTERGFIDG